MMIYYVYDKELIYVNHNHNNYKLMQALNFLNYI